LRDETDVNSIAVAVSVISSEDIEKSGKTSVTDLLESAPGVSLSGTTGSTRRAFQSRGYGDNSYGRVLVLLDGIPLNNPDMSAPDLSWIQVSSIKQIEVYKGDASALYGNQASAGVISITTKETGKKSAFVEAGASSKKSVFGSAKDAGVFLMLPHMLI
jgi:iron complex outermembrane recepter protein